LREAIQVLVGARAAVQALERDRPIDVVVANERDLADAAAAEHAHRLEARPAVLGGRLLACTHEPRQHGRAHRQRQPVARAACDRSFGRAFSLNRRRERVIEFGHASIFHVRSAPSKQRPHRPTRTQLHRKLTG